MLEFMMGKESFRKGIHNYLTKHKYNNTITQNLWDDLDEQYNVRDTIKCVDHFTFTYYEVNYVEGKNLSL